MATAPATRAYRLDRGVHGRFENGQDKTYVAGVVGNDIMQLTDAEANGASLKGRVTLVTGAEAAAASAAPAVAPVPAVGKAAEPTADDTRWDFVWETSIADLTELIANTTDRDELASIADAEDRNPNDARSSVRRLVDARVKKMDRQAEEAAALAAAGE